MMRIAPLALAGLLAGCGTQPATQPLHYEPGPSTLTQTYGISPEESARRLNAEQWVGELNTKLHNGALPGFSNLWIQHAPRYAVMVAFTRPTALAQVQRLAHPSIRGDLVVIQAQRTLEQIMRDQERVTAAFTGAPRGSWSVGYRPQSEKFEVDTQNQAIADYGLARLPADLRDDVVVRVTGLAIVPL